MGEEASTYWTLIRDAGRGSRTAREAFALRYERVIRSYLTARWRGTPLYSETDDATQEVFVACFGEKSPLARAEPGRTGGFRAFLHGVVRNTALVFERKHARRRARVAAEIPHAEKHAAEEDGLATVFDRAWATALVRQARAHQAKLARQRGDASAQRRIDLLRLRFHEGMPIREIARLWDEEPKRLHRQYRS